MPYFPSSYDYLEIGVAYLRDKLAARTSETLFRIKQNHPVIQQCQVKIYILYYSFKYLPTAFCFVIA
ncbi:hypothetical protein [Nostoc sp.]|uniref:hypothetical protein n=1 Tax=Nostoc sp. TaxID=1180 RepID=UPI002FF724E9